MAFARFFHVHFLSSPHDSSCFPIPGGRAFFLLLAASRFYGRRRRGHWYGSAHLRMGRHRPLVWLVLARQPLVFAYRVLIFLRAKEQASCRRVYSWCGLL